MRRVKQLVLLSVIAAALLVPVASASAGTQTACTFDGVTGNLSPAIPSILEDGSTDTETGQFTFNGGVTCAGNDRGNPVNPTAETGSVSASGNYSNILCGTGRAEGDATVTLPSGTVQAHFVIDFTGGNGVITITAAVRSTGETGGTGRGDAQLRPASGNCVNQSVSAFQVVGGFTTIFP